MKGIGLAILKGSWVLAVSATLFAAALIAPAQVPCPQTAQDENAFLTEGTYVCESPEGIVLAYSFLPNGWAVHRQSKFADGEWQVSEYEYEYEIVSGKFDLLSGPFEGRAVVFPELYAQSFELGSWRTCYIEGEDRLFQDAAQAGGERLRFDRGEPEQASALLRNVDYCASGPEICTLRLYDDYTAALTVLDDHRTGLPELDEQMTFAGSFDYHFNTWDGPLWEDPAGGAENFTGQVLVLRSGETRLTFFIVGDDRLFRLIAADEGAETPFKKQYLTADGGVSVEEPADGGGSQRSLLLTLSAVTLALGCAVTAAGIFGAVRAKRDPQS